MVSIGISDRTVEVCGTGFRDGFFETRKQLSELYIVVCRSHTFNISVALLRRSLFPSFFIVLVYET